VNSNRQNPQGLEQTARLAGTGRIALWKGSIPLNAPENSVRIRRKKHKTPSGVGTGKAPGLRSAPEKKRSPLFRFVFSFALCCVLAFVVLNLLPAPWLRPVLSHTAWTLGRTLSIAGLDVSVAGDTVSSADFAVCIVPECTALFAAALYLSFVISYPAPLAMKLAGAALGVPALWAANLARLALVFAAAHHDRTLFEAVHVYFGQVFTGCAVFMACFLWLGRVRKAKPEQNAVMGPWGFLARFAVYSTVSFFIWLHINPSWVRLVDRCMAAVFSIFGRELFIRRDLDVYYYTFNVVLFLSLVLSTRSGSVKNKVKVLALGLGLIFVGHLLYRTCNALVTAYGILWPAIAGGILGTVGQYLFPVLLWLVLVRPGTVRPRDTSKPHPRSETSRRKARGRDVPHSPRVGIRHENVTGL
jgi:exosortase/archaeosortase family protein